MIGIVVFHIFWMKNWCLRCKVINLFSYIWLIYFFEATYFSEKNHLFIEANTVYVVIKRIRKFVSHLHLIIWNITKRNFKLHYIFIFSSSLTAPSNVQKHCSVSANRASSSNIFLWQIFIGFQFEHFDFWIRCKPESVIGGFLMSPSNV